MTIQSEIVTALAGVASGKVYPDAAPEDTEMPMVIYRRTSYEPENTLLGYAGIARSTFVFECWSATKSGALTLAADVATAIESSAIATKYREPASGEEYEPAVDQFMEPATYSFWHA